MPITEEKCREIFGRSKAELIQITDTHTLTVQEWLSSRSPKAAKFSGMGTRASSTGFKIAFLNLALGCNYHEGMSEDEIGMEVEEVKRFFAERGVPWYWWLNAQPSPKNIGRILEKHGLEYDAPGLPAMIAQLQTDSSKFPSYGNNIRVWRARSIEDLKVASKIRRIAFRFTEGEALSYFEDMPQDWLSNESPARLFLAGPGESEAVSIGAVIDGAGIPGIYVMATLPEHHRKGYGKAIMTRLMAEASKSGVSIIALTASKAGAGLYSQFGFVHLFDFDFYSLQSGAK